MNETTITENNKLIAEFMDVYPRESEPHTGLKQWYSPIDLDIAGLPDEMTYSDELKFHASWDWLMPVVERIFSLGYDYTMKPRGMDIRERLGQNIVSITGEGEPQEKVVYKAVIEFIKRYNENKED